MARQKTGPEYSMYTPEQHEYIYILCQIGHIQMYSYSPSAYSIQFGQPDSIIRVQKYLNLISLISNNTATTITTTAV